MPKNDFTHRLIQVTDTVLTAVFWVIIFLSIFLPHSVDYWLPEG